MPADYSLLDATLEILLMLLAAFLLGWLFCWLMKKLLGRKHIDDIEYTQDIDSQNLNLQANRPQRTGLSVSSRERLYDPDVGIPRTDVNTDVDVEIPTVKEPELGSVEIEAPTVNVDLPDADLKAPRPRIDIPDLKAPDIPDLDIKGRIDHGLDAGKGAIGKGLGAAAAGIGAVAVGASTLKDKAADTVANVDLNLGKPDADLPEAEVDSPTLKADIDLPSVDRTDLNMDVELPDLDADTSLPDTDISVDRPEVDVSDLNADIDVPDLKTDIDLPEVGTPGFETPSLSTDTSLPDVDLASKDIDLSDLDLPEANIDIETPDVSLPSINTPDIADDVSGAVSSTAEEGKGLGAAAAGMGAVAAGASSLKDKASEKIDEIGDSLTRPDLPENKDRADIIDDGRIIGHSSVDDLTRITGIDDTIATLLNRKGIDSYDKLRKTDRGTLKSYVQETLGHSTDIEPASWPHQAKLCAEKNWVKLGEYQSFLAGDSKEIPNAHTSASFDDAVKDDLKKIEGIGPFFESLLNKAGITTYAQLKNSDRDTLKQIIDAAGPDYRMHEPETWPYQAGLADRGDWKKLQDYINFMTGRS